MRSATRNRRRHPRVTLSREVQYVVGRRVFRHQLVDIGEGGACLSGGTPLPPDRLFKLFVPLPKSGTRRDRLCLIWGRVVWVNNERFGVEFVDPPIESVLQVRDAVRLAA
jgi:hypothetical protein